MMNPSVQGMKEANTSAITQYETPFCIEDLEIFDDEMLRVILINCGLGLTVEKLARSLHGVNEGLIQRIEQNLLSSHRPVFLHELHRPISEALVKAERRDVLRVLFWELTYWKTPDLYEELIEGEQLHPGIFQQLELDIRNKLVLDVGAGSGRATLECVKYGARKVYAIEPSPGLLRILRQKLVFEAELCCVMPLQGLFDKLPLADESVDTVLSCSAFTADPAQGGESGLAEFKRVIKPGGKIVIIWPRTQDHDWLAKHGFHYVTLPVYEEMRIHFRTLQSAIRCAHRFNAQNRKVIEYLLRERKPEIPFSMLGLNPPCDYCWLKV
jgi:ubiquinone/menaquinone biosynthesis C-methylase UbiE